MTDQPMTRSEAADAPRCSTCGQLSPCAHVLAVVEEADRARATSPAHHGIECPSRGPAPHRVDSPFADAGHDDAHWRAARDAIAFGVMCTDREWNGDTWHQRPWDARLDELTDQYVQQTESGDATCRHPGVSLPPRSYLEQER